MTDKGSFVSISTCLALHAPRCFVALCAHLFKARRFSLHLSPSLSPSLPRPPSFPLVICFSPVGFGIPFIERTLFSSYPFQRMGPERQNGWLWVLSSLPQLLTTPLLAPCHTMMSWLLFVPGVPIDSLHTLCVSLLHPLLCLTSTPASLCRSLSQILLLLKRCLGDLGMFGCCLAHPRYMLDTQSGKPSTPRIQRQFPFKSYWFNSLPLLQHLSLLLLFLSGDSAQFGFPCWEVIIDALIYCAILP